MKKRIALLGFSTAGKSTLIRSIGQYYLLKQNKIKEIVLKDTDSMISEKYGGHIYNIFFALVEGTNRDPALRYIEKAENEALGHLLTVNEPLVVGIGPGIPAVPIRPNWPNFHNTSFNIYIEQTPEEVYKGLMRRIERHIEDGLDGHRLFGCWDDDVTTRLEGGRWVPVPKEEVIKNINKHMRGLIPRYREAANYTIRKADLFAEGGIDALIENIIFRNLDLG